VKILQPNPNGIQEVSPANRRPNIGPRAEKVDPFSAQLEGEVKRLQETDMQRLQAIKEAIGKGEYRIDLEALAKAIVEKEIL